MTEAKPLVKKKNAIIQKTRSNMGEMEQKIWGYVCLVANNIPVEKIVPGQQLTVKFRASDYYNYYDITDGGKNYENLEKTLSNMRDIKMQIKTDNDFTAFGFIDNVYVNKNGDCEITINREMVPMITAINERTKDYTKIEAYNWGKMNGKYAIKLHEYLLSRYDKQIGKIDSRKKEQRKIDPKPLDIVMTLENLRLYFMVERIKTYKEYKFFNSKIIKPAVKEINENSEIYVTYFGKGRPIDRVVFTVCRKRVIND